MYVITCKMRINAQSKDEKDFYLMVNQLEGGVRWGTLNGIGELLVFPNVNEAMNTWNTYREYLVERHIAINRNSIHLKKVRFTDYAQLS